MRAVRNSVASGVTGALMLIALVLVPSPVSAQQRPVASAVPASSVQAESYARQHGTRVVAVPGASGGLMVGRISDGDWLRYDDVVVEDGNHTLLCFSSPAPAAADTVAIIDVRLGSRRGSPVTSVSVRNFAGPGVRQWAGGGTIPAGIHTVFLTVRQPSGGRPIALDYFLASLAPPPPSLNCP